MLNKKGIRKKACHITALLVLLSLPKFFANAQDSTELSPAPQDHLEIVFDEGNEPFMFEENKTLKGLYPAIVQAVFDRMETQVELSAMPWPRAIQQIDEGKTGIGGLYKNKIRLENYDFSTPIYTETLKLYTRKNETFPYNKIEDLSGKTIGVVRGWSYGDLFDNAKATGLFKTEPANNDYVNIEKLRKHHIDVIIAAPETLTRAIKDKNAGAEIEEIPTPVTTNHTHIAFNKSQKKQDLLEKFNQAFEAIKNEGIYQDIIKTKLPQK